MPAGPRDPWWQRASDWLLPPRCVSCGRRGHEICPQCWQESHPLTAPLCPRCSVPSAGGRLCHQCAGRAHPTRAILARYPFEGAIRAALVGLKYESRTRLAPHLAVALVAALEARPISFDVVVPVPLAPGRRQARGHNQSELLARALAAERGVELAPGILRREHETRPQQGLSARERRINVRGAFAAAPDSSLDGRRVMLVDDVCTTGATLDACAQALADAGAAGVWAVVVAREL
ncbi:MAG TPA: ComF family protein [Chloroflexota bacterium]